MDDDSFSDRDSVVQAHMRINERLFAYSYVFSYIRKEIDSHPSFYDRAAAHMKERHNGSFGGDLCILRNPSQSTGTRLLMLRCVKHLSDLSICKGRVVNNDHVP